MRSKDLTDDQLTQLREYIEATLKVEGDLRREVQADIRRKMEIGCYQACGTVAGYPFAASGPRPMRAPARAPSAPSPARRRPSNMPQPRRPDKLPPRRAEDSSQGKKNVPHGAAHIKSTFNNTIVSITDPQGNVIAWASSGHVGFKGLT